MEKDIYGMNFHHGFGVECYCDACRAEKNERMVRASVGKPIVNAMLIQRDSAKPLPNSVWATQHADYQDFEYE